MAAKIPNAQRLSDLLTESDPLDQSRVLAIVQQLTAQLETLHTAGKLARLVRADRITLDSDTARLVVDDSAAEVETENLSLPPELGHHHLPRLPDRIEAARSALRSAGVDLDPRRIDIFQLGCLACELLTGSSHESYLFSPRSKARLPNAWRRALDGMLGYDPSLRLNSCGQLRAELERISASDPSVAGVDTPPRGTGIDVLTNTPRSPHPAARPLPFQTLGQYEIKARLGSGGMGDVYQGYDPQLERTVALKVLPLELARQPDFVRRFVDEAKAAARLVHPNIVQIFFIGEDAGHHYFAMQYVAGETLAARMKRENRLSLDDALAIIEQVLSGLAVAHGQGLIHRDIKPGNILLDAEHRRALLADFGLVKSLDSSEQITATGMVMGTVDYISPEQGRGHKVDTRSDLYSVGVLLYQLLSGQLPFVAESATAMIFQHAYEKPRPLEDVLPDVAPGASAIVRRLLAKDPADRYQTADDLLADIRALRAAHGWQPASPLGLRDANPPFLSATEDSDFSDDDRRLTVALAPLPRPRWLDRLRVLFHLHAPALLKNLQNTEQQVDGALVVYQARRDKLAGLAHEAAAVARQLEEQGLETELHQQQAACEEIQLRLAKADATLQKLRSQQVLLRARLRVAQANQFMTGAGTPRTVSHPRFVLAATLGLAALVFVGFIYFARSAFNVGSGEPEPLVTKTQNAPTDAIRPAAGWFSLAPFIKVGHGAASDAWEAIDDGFRITKTGPLDTMGRFMEIPLLLRGSYELRFKSQMVRDRRRGFNVRFPVGTARACLGFGSTRGSNGIGINGVHGLEAMDTANPTSHPLFSNPPDVEREAIIRVDAPGNGTVHLAVSIDGAKEIDWSGKEDDVHMLESTVDAKLSKSPIIILHGWGDSVTLRQLALRVLDGWAEPLREAASSSTVPSPPAVPTSAAPAAKPDSPLDILTSDEWEWSKPVNAGPVINSDKDDAAPFISADGLALLFESRRSGGYGGLDIWMSTRSSVDQPWNTPVNLGPTINSDADDYRPTMTANGRYLVFSSNRPGGVGEADLYWVARPSSSEPWGQPINLGRPINSNFMERGSCVGPDGLTLIIGSDRPSGIGRNDLWITRRRSISDRWGRLENLGALVNSNLADKSPNLSSDGLVLVFQSDRAGGSGRSDIYMSTRASQNDPFGKPTNLGPMINTSGNEEHPALSADGKTLWFSSNRPGTLGGSDIWYSQRVKRAAH
jgi:serine/threonine protein kinase